MMKKRIFNSIKLLTLIMVVAILYISCPQSTATAIVTTTGNGGEGNGQEGSKPETPTFTVTFDSNGATSGTPPREEKAAAGDEIRLPNEGNLLKTNFNFGGWNTNYAGSGVTFSAGEAFTVPGRNVTLYAKWEANNQHDGGSQEGDTSSSTPEGLGRGSQTIPSTPTNVWAQASTAFSPVGSYEIITVKWDTVSGAIGYHVWRGFSISDNRIFIGSVTNTSYSDRNLPNNTTFFYWVSAYNGSGESAHSSPATATTNP